MPKPTPLAAPSSSLHLLPKMAILFFLLMCATLLSCATFKPPKDAITNPLDLKQKMQQYANSLKSARFPEVILEYYGNQDRVKVRQLILVKRPDYIRIQTRIPASNEILNLLVSHNGNFASHDRHNNRFYSGPATPQNISQLLPVDLTPSDLVDVMLGNAPWQKFRDLDPAQTTTSWDPNKGLYTYKATSSNGNTLIAWVDPNTFATKEVSHLDPNGQTIWNYQALHWQTFKGPDDISLQLPTYRRFLMPSKSIDFSLEYKKVELNPQLPDILFQLEPPPGSTSITFQEK